MRARRSFAETSGLATGDQTGFFATAALDAADDLFVGRIRRLEGRLERHRDLVHAIGGARRADARARPS